MYVSWAMEFIDCHTSLQKVKFLSYNSVAFKKTFIEKNGKMGWLDYDAGLQE